MIFALPCTGTAREWYLASVFELPDGSRIWCLWASTRQPCIWDLPSCLCICRAVDAQLTKETSAAGRERSAAIDRGAFSGRMQVDADGKDSHGRNLAGAGQPAAVQHQHDDLVDGREGDGTAGSHVSLVRADPGPS